LIRSRKASLRNWKLLRSWDVLDEHQVERISFMNRALLTDKRGRYFSLIGGYYQARNEIAHGSISRSLVAIPVIYRDIRRLYADLRP